MGSSRADSLTSSDCNLCLSYIVGQGLQFLFGCSSVNQTLCVEPLKEFTHGPKEDRE